MTGNDGWRRWIVNENQFNIMTSDLKKSMEGILTHYRDNEGQNKRLIDELAEKKARYICLSWDKIYLKKDEEVLELMRNKIKDDHRFDFYFFSENRIKSKAVVEDFACDEDEYARKAFIEDDSWEKRGACNLEEKFTDFSSDGKDVKIVFLLSEFTDDLSELPSYLLEGSVKSFDRWNDDGIYMHSYIIPYERIYSEDELNKLKNSIAMNEKFEGLIGECKQLLEENKNLILTGAPGTGKTYLAKQVVKALTGIETDDELEKSEQFGFVQFHPSYDYTDFVEGLRPTKPDEKGNIGFELKPGVFKTFCEGARKNIEDSLKSGEEISMEKQLAEKYGKLVELIQNEEEPVELYFKTGKRANIYDVSDNNNIRFTRGDGVPITNVVSLQRLRKIAEKYRSTADLANLTTGEIRKIVGGCNPSIFWAVLNYLYTQFGDLKENETKEEIVKRKIFVFVIDEINRGEISKIFGELFFSIDPGYRGEKGAVDTQYANMHDEDEGKFYVPENVYIIGTMNDIDRSVESFDFAMRRRFTWKEITAEDSAKSMALSPETVKRMNALNKKIADVEGLGQAYQIGGAYFLGIDEKECEDGDDGKHLNYGKVWELKLEPLLKEYLRGMPDAKNTLKSMKDAYDLKKEEQVQQGTEMTQVNADEPTTQSSNN
ncbi:MAG: AAA family ATPase [Bacteroidales bacterium]|nr:AAA family ATPase [Bacteroidales bacterium]